MAVTIVSYLPHFKGTPEQQSNRLQHDDLRPEYEKNLTGTAPHPAKMRFLDGDNDDYRNYQALCRGDNLRVSSQGE